MNMLEKYNISKHGYFLSAIVLVLFSSSAVSEGRIHELGRLFTDVAQREKLNAIRQGAYDGEAEQQSTVSAVTVNGIMMRSNGENVVWVNGSSTLKGSPAKGVNIYPRSADRHNYNVPVSVDGKHVRIKPGQSWTEGSDQIRDSY
jgi:hypothetical protein